MTNVLGQIEVTVTWFFRPASHQDATFLVKLSISLFICMSLHPPRRRRVLYLTLLVIR